MGFCVEIKAGSKSSVFLRADAVLIAMGESCEPIPAATGGQLLREQERSFRVSCELIFYRSLFEHLREPQHIGRVFPFRRPFDAGPLPGRALDKFCDRVQSLRISGVSCSLFPVEGKRGNDSARGKPTEDLPQQLTVTGVPCFTRPGAESGHQQQDQGALYERRYEKDDIGRKKYKTEQDQRNKESQREDLF